MSEVVEDQASIEMPRYKCHKVVHALKIAELRADGSPPGLWIVPAEEGFAADELSVVRFRS